MQKALSVKPLIRFTNFKNKLFMVGKIGENAGLVWNALSDGSKKNVKELKKATKLTDKDLYAALGWLAREAKLELEEDGAEVLVKLI